MRKNEVQQRFMDIHDASRYLGMTEKSLRYKVEARRLPFAKIGKSIRFDRLELDRFIARNTVQPIALRRR